MASKRQAVVKAITPKERIERLESELALWQRGYVILEITCEKIIEQYIVCESVGKKVDLTWIRHALDDALLNAQDTLHESAHPVDRIEKIFCEGCHTFLTEASEAAGMCLKCACRG